MKYLIIGAGGVGGTVGALLANAKKDVSYICHNETLRIIKENGIILHSEINGDINAKVKAYDWNDYNDSPDVVFVCVKGYSLDSIIPNLKRVVTPNTIVIPLLNIYGTGEYLQKQLPCDCLDGCIYVMADILERGVIIHRKCETRVVYGYRDGKITDKLLEIEKDILEAKMTPILSKNIKRDTYLKYSLISTMASVGVYYDANVGEILDSEEKTNFFINLCYETELLGKKLGLLNSLDDLVERNMGNMQNITREGTTSLQKDLKKKGDSEIEGIIFNVVKLATQNGLVLPYYNKVCEKMHF